MKRPLSIACITGVFALLMVLPRSETRGQEKENIPDIIGKISEHPAFIRWFEYWQSQVPEIDLDSLETTRYFIPPPEWQGFKFRKLQKGGIDALYSGGHSVTFSPDSSAAADLLRVIETETSGDTLYIKGFGPDWGFVIANLNDSTYFRHTGGPGTAIHECIWYSYTAGVVIIMYTDRIGKNKGDIKVSFFDIDTKEKTIEIFSMHPLPLRFGIDGIAFLQHKFPGRIVIKK